MQNLPLFHFLKPEPEKEFAALKILQSDGGVVRLPREDWDGARERITQDGSSWAAWFSEKRAAINHWVNRHRDHADWHAGWHHNFVSPVDGSFLEWTEEIPGKDANCFHSLSGHDVEITPALFDAWVFGFRRRHLEMLSDAAACARIIGDNALAEWVAGQIDFYADNYPAWAGGLKKNDAHLGCQSLDDAIFVMRLTEAARIIFPLDIVTPERRTTWFERLFKPEAELLARSFRTIHNIAFWHRAAQAQIALLYRNEPFWQQAVEDKTCGLRIQLERGVTSDYFWHEQSMLYNEFILRAGIPLLIFAGLREEGHRLRHEAAILQNMLLSPLGIRFPDGTLPSPADATHIQPAKSPWLALASRVLPTTTGLQMASGQLSWSALLDTPDSDSLSVHARAPAPELPPVVARNMESSRFALLRQGRWQVFFHYGQIVLSHSQKEALNWEASFDGVDISRDAGTVGYGARLSRGYYSQGISHNVPLADGLGQESFSPGSLIHFDGENAMVTASQPDYRPGHIAATRTLRIDGDTFVEETTIRNLTPEKSSACLGLALHFQGTPRLPVGFREVNADDFIRGRPESFRWWRKVCVMSCHGCLDIEMDFSKGLVMRLRISTPGSFMLYHGLSPGRPPEFRASFYLELEPGRAEATFITKIQPLEMPDRTASYS
ncbi:Heparinase II/III-like protein [Opitutaceae bacterium TAV1]|nr:Heparinase II/III-like protein [Opitutaceae bacterium TAV1]